MVGLGGVIASDTSVSGVTVNVLVPETPLSVAVITDVLNGKLTIGSNTITLGGTGTTDTLQDLAKTIDAGAYGVTAIYSQTNKDIVFTTSNSALGASGALTFTAAAG